MELEYIATFAAVSVASLVFWDLIKDVFFGDPPKEPPRNTQTDAVPYTPPPPQTPPTPIYYPPQQPIHPPANYNGRDIDFRKLGQALELIDMMEERGSRRW